MSSSNYLSCHIQLYIDKVIKKNSIYTNIVCCYKLLFILTLLLRNSRMGTSKTDGLLKTCVILFCSVRNNMDSRFKYFQIDRHLHIYVELACNACNRILTTYDKQLSFQTFPYIRAEFHSFTHSKKWPVKFQTFPGFPTCI